MQLTPKIVFRLYKSPCLPDHHCEKIIASRQFFRTQLKLHCSAVLCAKPYGKRLLFSPEKSSEGTLYSVPSFGGHIAISHDVTVYPILVMARTVRVISKTSGVESMLTNQTAV